MEELALTRVVLIAAGATLGALARYALSLWAANRFGLAFPYGTLIVNASGSFLLGFLLGLSVERLAISPETRLFLIIGFFGSYTTFSTFAVESVVMLQSENSMNGLLNIFGMNLLSLMLAFSGIYLARLIR